MPEVEFPMKLVGLAYLCDDCGEEMMNRGLGSWSDPATYPHTCPNGHTATLRRCYPNTAYRRA
jgi:predicted RNA-binding Zn-ribbon protein involved in translation (DUF1610 family)